MPPRDATTLYSDLPAAHTLTPGQGLVISDINGRAAPQKCDVQCEKRGRGKRRPDQPPAPRDWRVQVEIYPVDVKVKQKGRYQPSPKAAKVKPGKKQKIVSLSDKSRRALVFTARNVTGLTHMITLTYPSDFPSDGQTVKKHLERFRHWLTRRGIGGMWVLEFQSRGAPHFHIWTDGAVNKKDLSEAWYSIVASGD
jgi:hypothetical protein